MGSPSKERLILAATAAMSVIAAGRPALAVNCKDLPSPTYGYGGSSIKTLIGKVATILTNANPPETFIYQAPGNCFGVNALLGNVKITGTASYWDAAGKEQSCDLSIAGDTVQVAGMNTYATLCPGVQSLPATIGDFLGPIQAFDFIVPKASSQTSISAAAAYFAYGFGATGQAAPWINEAEIIKRDQNSAVALLVSQAIGVPVQKLKGVDAKSNGNTVTLVSTAPDAEAALGFVADEIAQASSATVSVLAYQHYKQDCGYWPSSTATSFDKQNIRHGQYFIWGNVHFLANVDGQNKPTDPGAASWIGYFTGQKPLPGPKQILEVEINAGTVPDCAMEVKRTSDLGDVQSYAPSAPCGCYFDFVGTGQTSCQACAANADCPASATNCRHGYCEVN